MTHVFYLCNASYNKLLRYIFLSCIIISFLRLDIGDDDPESSFSHVMYEKGSQVSTERMFRLTFIMWCHFKLTTSPIFPTLSSLHILLKQFWERCVNKLCDFVPIPARLHKSTPQLIPARPTSSSPFSQNRLACKHSSVPTSVSLRRWL
jgi:hypothetical protein